VKAAFIQQAKTGSEKLLLYATKKMEFSGINNGCGFQHFNIEQACSFASHILLIDFERCAFF
jgi:hypothetical protein